MPAVVLWGLSRLLGVTGLEGPGTVLWNLYYPVLGAGLVVLWPRARGAAARARVVIEALTVGVATGLLVYYFVARHAQVPLSTLLLNAVGETVVMTASAVLLSLGRSEPAARTLGIATLLATVSDLMLASAAPGSRAEVVGTVLLCLAAAVVATAGLRRPGQRRSRQLPAEVLLRGLGHLPTASSIAVLSVFILEVQQVAGAHTSDATRWIAMGLGVVVLLQLGGLALAHYAAELEEDARAAQTERLSSAQRLLTLGQLTGAAVHDLKNVIVVLGDVAGRLKEQAVAPAEVEDLELVTARASTICAELLSVGRPRPGQVISLGAVVHETESLLRRLVTRTLELELVADGALSVSAERAQLEMALVNLVSNARDATTRGSISVRAEARTVAAGDWFAQQGVAPGSWISLSVRDTGTGMPPEFVARAFDAFVTTKGDRGTGLGLAQVRDFVRAAHGHALIESSPGAGTTVWLLSRPA